jgi:hypothetical protein
MRKNSKTIKIAKSALMKSLTCNCSFLRKGIFSHDQRLRGEFSSGSLSTLYFRQHNSMPLALAIEGWCSFYLLPFRIGFHSYRAASSPSYCPKCARENTKSDETYKARQEEKSASEDIRPQKKK